MFRVALALFVLTAIGVASIGQAQQPPTREEKVRNDREQFKDDDSWIYNNLEQGMKLAKADNRPLLVIFRCIPCEACALFDEQVVHRDPKIRELMDKFVCVRIPMANAMDLTRFQYDYDLSFTAFFMNPDGTIYGRFGTRSNREHAESDISMEGFAAALDGALKLHAGYPGNKAYLAGKQAKPVEFKSPEEYPSLKGKYKDSLDYTGQVVKSCLHCHQIRDAEREFYRSQGKPLPEISLRPYPMPQVIGITLDEKTRGTVKSIEPGSAAAKAGIQPDDELFALDGQVILSIADVQWVLHNAPAAAKLPVLLGRGSTSENITLTIELDKGWRDHSDISWRVTSWTLRRMVTGGMVLTELSDDERKNRGLADDSCALLVKAAGRYGPHAAARNAGFKEGDVLLAFGERTERMNESDLFCDLMNTTRPGQKIDVTVLRDGKRLTLKLPMQP